MFLVVGLAFIDNLGIEARWTERYAVVHEPSRLALTILGNLGSHVERRGGTFLVAILLVRADRPFPYQALLDAIEHQFDTIQTAPRLFQHVKDRNSDALFSTLHYSAEGNAVVAEVLAKTIAGRTLLTEKFR